MRITNRMISERLLSTIGGNRARASNLQLDLATTKTLRKPSDDPAGMRQLNEFKILISRNQQYSKNITQIRGFVSTEIAALETVVDFLEKAKQTAVQGASDTLGAQEREALAKTIDQTIDALIAQGNSKFNDRYVFAGTLTKGTAPLTRTGDVVTYNGNEKAIVGQIGAESQITYAKTGTQIFNPAGGTDIFATLAALKQGLENDDTNAIQASIETLDQAIEQTVAISADLGIISEKLNLTEELIENENLRHADAISKIADTDVTETIVKFSSLQNATTTALRALSETLQTSLIDFIG